MSEFQKSEHRARQHSFDNKRNYFELILRQHHHRRANSRDVPRHDSRKAPRSDSRRRSRQASPQAGEDYHEELTARIRQRLNDLSSLCSRAHSASSHKRAHSDERKPHYLRSSNKENSREQRDLAAEIAAQFRQKNLPAASSLEFYRVGKLLGKGAFGKVYLGFHRLTGLEVAIKTIDKVAINDERTQKKVLNEVFIMKKLAHPNVVRLLEVVETRKHLLLIQEYAGGGDLLQLLKARGSLPEAEAKLIIRQVVEGLHACHLHHVVHRDLKLDNVLLNTELTEAKLGDFGVSRLARPGEKIYDQCGTPAYLAPEIIVGTGHEPAYADLWSLGILIYALLCGTVPFKARTLPELHKLILKGRFHLPSTLSSQAKDVIRVLLNPVPQLRISLAELKEHPWFSTHDEPELDESFSCRFLGTALPEVVPVNNSALLEQVERLGFPRDYVLQSLGFHDLNHATATYHLLGLNQAKH